MTDLLIAIAAVTFMVIVGFVWAQGQVDAHARELEQKSKALQLSDVDNMTGSQFEIFVGELLRHRGYNVQITGKSGDLGVDIIAQNAHERCAVQTKRQAKKVSRTAVSDAVAGSMHYGCNIAMVVTNSYFTEGTYQLAQTTGCKLINREELAMWIIDYQREKQSASNLHTGSEDKIIVTCPCCLQKNRAVPSLLHRTNCGKCRKPLLKR